MVARGHHYKRKYYKMKQRILTGWTINRIIFVLMGLAIGLQAAMQSEWLGILLGGYFMSMGIFAFGCAGGQCYVPPRRGNTSVTEINKVNKDDA